MKSIQSFLIVLSSMLFFCKCDSNAVSNAHSIDSLQTKTDVCVRPVSAADTSTYICHNVEVKGDVEQPFSFTIDDLKKMKVVGIDTFNLVCQTGATLENNFGCKGVLLKDILNKAKIKQTGHKDRNFYILARASDNYMATFSWSEIFNNITGENTYVIFEENGKPIQRKGEMILICINDIKTGPRHVFWLKSIEVYRVN